MQNDNSDQYFDDEQMIGPPVVSKMLGISPQQLRNLWMAGQFPAPARWGKRVYRWPKRVVIEHFNRKFEEANNGR